MLIDSYINTSGNWKNEKLCGNTTPAGRSVFTEFRAFPIFTSVDITVHQYGKNVLYFFYNIAQRTSTEEWREIFRVDIELYILRSSIYSSETTAMGPLQCAVSWGCRQMSDLLHSPNSVNLAL